MDGETEDGCEEIWGSVCCVTILVTGQRNVAGDNDGTLCACGVVFCLVVTKVT